MLHRISQRVRSEPCDGLEQSHVVVSILFELTRIDGERPKQEVVLEQRQRSHRTILDRRFRVYVDEVKTRMKLVNWGSIRQRKPCDSFSECDRSCGQLLRILADSVAGGRVTFGLVVKIDDASVEGYDVAHL